MRVLGRCAWMDHQMQVVDPWLANLSKHFVTAQFHSNLFFFSLPSRYPGYPNSLLLLLHFILVTVRLTQIFVVRQLKSAPLFLPTRFRNLFVTCSPAPKSSGFSCTLPDPCALLPCHASQPFDLNLALSLAGCRIAKQSFHQDNSIVSSSFTPISPSIHIRILDHVCRNTKD